MVRKSDLYIEIMEGREEATFAGRSRQATRNEAFSDFFSNFFRDTTGFDVERGTERFRGNFFVEFSDRGIIMFRDSSLARGIKIGKKGGNRRGRGNDSRHREEFNKEGKKGEKK